MEWLWRVNERDEPLGRVERNEAHAHGIRHRAGVVILRDKHGRVFLTQRAASKQIFPRTYDTSASFHVAHGETYEQAAQREAQEELGLASPLQGLEKFYHDDPPEHQFVMVFTMAHQGENIVLDPSEASAGRFYTRSEAEDVARHQTCTPWLGGALRLLTIAKAW